MSEPQKDVTPTVFGLLIAYVLPGLFALFTMALFSGEVANQLRSFSGAESSVGLFLLVILTAVLLGMQLQAFRWLLFEKFFEDELPSADLKALRQSETLILFRLFIDEMYRHHQFYGALSIVVPFFFWGLGKKLDVVLISGQGFVLILVGVLVEAVTVVAALEGLRRYLARSRAALTTKGE